MTRPVFSFFASLGYLVFLCSGAASAQEQNLSGRGRRSVSRGRPNASRRDLPQPVRPVRPRPDHLADLLARSCGQSGSDKSKRPRHRAGLFP
jgi:hypothetical protein